MTLDKQTAMKFEKMKAQIADLEKRLAAHERALEAIASDLEVEIDLSGAPTEAEVFARQRLERSSKALLASDEVKEYLAQSQGGGEEEDDQDL